MSHFHILFRCVDVCDLTFHFLPLTHLHLLHQIQNPKTNNKQILHRFNSFEKYWLWAIFVSFHLPLLFFRMGSIHQSQMFNFKPLIIIVYKSRTELWVQFFRVGRWYIDACVCVSHSSGHILCVLIIDALAFIC